MVSLILLEKDPFVRGDISDVVENYFSDLILVSKSDLAEFAETLCETSAKKIAMISGTCEEIKVFFSSQKPNKTTSFIVLNDSTSLEFPSDYSIVKISKPFTNDTLANGIKTAISFLHSDR